MYLINEDWDNILKEELEKEYFKTLYSKVLNEYKINECYPVFENIFRAFKLTSYNDIKVVILGQDPYHGKGEANGLCFSVNENIKIPPSLKNIFKELQNDLGIVRTDTNLEDWSKQGILLLNSILSVKKDCPLSHSNYGWEIFTDNIIRLISKKNEKVIFVLWGNYARKKKSLIDNRHYIIESAHPSPLSASRGFFNSKPFSKINSILEKENKKQINW